MENSVRKKNACHACLFCFSLSHLFTAAALRSGAAQQGMPRRADAHAPAGHAIRGRALEPTGIREELVQSRLRSGNTDVGFAGQLEERRGKRSLRSHGNDMK